MSCHRCQVFSKIKTQAPELIPIKVNTALELVGIDLIGKCQVKLDDTLRRSLFSYLYKAQPA